LVHERLAQVPRTARGEAQEVGKLFDCKKRVTADQVEHLIVATDTRFPSTAGAIRCASPM
jgi:hypothetical protein